MSTWYGGVFTDKQMKKQIQPCLEYNKAVEKRGIPQLKDGSTRISSHWIPCATRFVSDFRNKGVDFLEPIQVNQDAGRLLYLFTVGGHLDLTAGEAMIVLPGTTECIVRWLEGLNGMKFKLTHTSDIDYLHLKIGSSVGKTFIDMAAIPYYAVQDLIACAKIENSTAATAANSSNAHGPTLAKSTTTCTHTTSTTSTTIISFSAASESAS